MDFVREAERHGDTAALCLSHRSPGTTYVTMGEFVAGRQHLERARASITRKSTAQSGRSVLPSGRRRSRR